MAYLSSNKLQGKYNNGDFDYLEIDSLGHLKTKNTSPSTAFGEQLVAENTPVIQAHFNYNINSDVFSG